MVSVAIQRYFPATSGIFRDGQGLPSTLKLGLPAFDHNDKRQETGDLDLALDVQPLGL